MIQLESDLGCWERELSQDRPALSQLKDGRKHLAIAIFSAASGLYGGAYGSLRTFLELSFASVYFSANEYSRRRWQSGRQDFSWTAALDGETGVLSRSFVQEFNAQAVNEAPEFSRKAAEAYRECSEYIHGKMSHSLLIPDTLQYSSALLSNWCKIALSAEHSVLFLLHSRYSDELVMTDDLSDALAETLEHSFPSLRSVRKLLQLPFEEESDER